MGKKRNRVRGHRRRKTHPGEKGQQMKSTKNNEINQRQSAESPQAMLVTNDNRLFHNPYHFIPVSAPNKDEHWLRLGEGVDSGVSEESTTTKKSESFRKQAIARDSTNQRLSHDGYLNQVASDPVYSGRLICRLETCSPIFIGARRSKEATKPAEIQPFELESGKPALPATTLRGLISSLAEAASGSSLRVLEDRVLSYRKPVEQGLRKLGIIVFENGDYLLRPLGRLYKLGTKVTSEKKSFRIDKKQFFYLRKKSYKHFKVNDPADLLTEDEILGDHFQQESNYIRGILRILGNPKRIDLPDNRKYELFIIYSKEQEKKDPIKILPEAIERFEQLADERTRATEKAGANLLEIHPYHPLGTERNTGDLIKEEQKNLKHKLRLKDGDIVYFNETLQNGESVVDEISFSAIWRGCVEDEHGQAATVHKFFEKIDAEADPELLPFNSTRQYLSPAELLFGFVQENSKQENDKKEKAENHLAYAGRVCCSFGRLAPGQRDPFYLPPVTLKILSTPKPPSPVLYFKRKNAPDNYIPKTKTKDKRTNQEIEGLNLKDHCPQGRKLYLHHRSVRGESQKPPWETYKPHDETLQKVRITPISEGTVFYFHIDFTHLNAWELGLLCFALRPSDNFRHKLGLGKPIGLGTIKIDPVGLFTIDREQRYQAQDIFSDQRYHASWFALDYLEEWKVHYPVEAAAASQDINSIWYPEGGTEGWQGFRDTFVESVPPDVYQALKLLGEFDETQGKPVFAPHPIHYPQVAGVSEENLEDKHYRWFVANDVGTGKKSKNNNTWIKPQQKKLKPLTTQSEKIPTLPRHDWVEDG